MAPSYKLTYFDIRGRAEPARLIFASAGVPYEDVRIKGEDWPKLKSSFTWGTVPCLEVDGKALNQSVAIVRYLGNKFNLAGENDFESAKCDEIVESMGDVIKVVQPAFSEKDETKKKEIVEKVIAETFPKYFSKWVEILEANRGFFVGKKLSYADIFITACLQMYNDNLGAGNLLKKYPALEKHQEMVYNSPGIKEYIAKRPHSLR